MSACPNGSRDPRRRIPTRAPSLKELGTSLKKFSSFEELENHVQALVCLRVIGTPFARRNRTMDAIVRDGGEQHRALLLVVVMMRIMSQAGPVERNVPVNGGQHLMRSKKESKSKFKLKS